MTRYAWTMPYLGVQHFPAGGIEPDSAHWATVEEFGAFARLLCWSPGCAYRPLAYMFETVDEARWIGEAYVLSGGRVSPRKETALA